MVNAVKRGCSGVCVVKAEVGVEPVAHHHYRACKWVSTALMTNGLATDPAFWAFESECDEGSMEEIVRGQ